MPGPMPTPASSTLVSSRVLTILFTDLAGSTALKRKLGDTIGTERILRHHDLVRHLVEENDGRILNTAGDGFMIVFITPSDAVAFSLQLQEAHFTSPELPRVRVGIHMGEVSEIRTVSETGDGIQLDGFAVDLAARIQALALPGQTLVSYVVFENARQRLGAVRFPRLVWRSHGRYLFKGHDRPLAVFEAGVEGFSPLVPPMDHEKAHHVPDSETKESAVRWRPAAGLEMPRRPNWALVNRLGAGGGGEVWLAAQRGTGERRVFKFCFDHQQLRALQREVTVFRLLKEELGDRPDIARVLDWQFDEPPFYLEFEHVGGVALPQWAEEQGGLTNVELSTRVELVAQVADAVAAAHSIGILHKDIKPSNILVVDKPGSLPCIRMIDFGIGVVTDRELLAARGITALGLTQTAADNYSSHSGTRLYMAPELLEGQPITTGSDVYSLGVVLYQMVVGNLQHAIAEGWQREVSDELLMRDIAACVDGRPERRLSSAAELAKRLRTLDQRRAILLEEREREARAAEITEVAAKARQRNRWLLAAIVTMLVLLGMSLAMIVQQQQRSRLQALLKLRESNAKSEAVRLKMLAEVAEMDAIRQREQAEKLRYVAETEQYHANIGFADANLRQGRILKTLELLYQKTPPELRSWEWGYLLRKSSPALMTLAKYDSPGGALHGEYNPEGDRIATGDRNGQVTIYDAKSGRRLMRAKPHQRFAWRLSWSNDGKRIGVAGLDHLGSVLDASNLNVLTMLRGSGDIVRGVDFSPDGSRIVTSGADRTIREYDSFNGKPLLQFKQPSGVVYNVDYSPDGTKVVSASLGGTVDLWDAQTGALIRTFPQHGKAVHSARFSPDGTRIMSAGADRNVRVFDVQSGEQLQCLSNPTDWMHWATYSADGSRIVSSDDSGVCRIWDAQTSAELGMLQDGTQMYRAFFNPDGRRLVTANWDTVKVWDVDSILELPTRPEPPVATALDAQLLEGFERARVICYPVERGRDWKNYDSPFNVPSGQTTFVSAGRTFAVHSFFSAFSPDLTKRIAIDERTMKAFAVDVRTSAVQASLGEGATYSSVFSPDGKLAAVGGYRNIVTVYDPQTWRANCTIRNVGSPNVLISAVRFSPDSRRLFVGSFDGYSAVFDVASGTTVSAFRAHLRPVIAAEFTPDGSRIATGSTDKTAKLFEVKSGAQLTTMTGHTSYVHGIAFSPDTSRTLTCSDDDTAKLWETDTGREMIPVFDGAKDDEKLMACGFTHDGRCAYAVTSKSKLLIANAFPWQPSDYPAPDAPIEKRIELYKRMQLNPKASLEDIDW